MKFIPRLLLDRGRCDCSWLKSINYLLRQHTVVPMVNARADELRKLLDELGAM